MIFFGTKYVELLERELETARMEIERLRASNSHLTDVIVRMSSPATSSSAPPRTAADMVQKKPLHQMKKAEKSAECLCGWHVLCDDPVELQQKVSAHYRETLQPVRSAGRKTWPQIKNMLESNPERTQ
jgi:hypothetical protein